MENEGDIKTIGTDSGSDLWDKGWSLDDVNRNSFGKSIWKAEGNVVSLIKENLPEEYKRYFYYWFEVKDWSNPSELLKWIFHLNGKVFFRGEVVTDLLDLFEREARAHGILLS